MSKAIFIYIVSFLFSFFNLQTAEATLEADPTQPRIKRVMTHKPKINDSLLDSEAAEAGPNDDKSLVPPIAAPATAIDPRYRQRSSRIVMGDLGLSFTDLARLAKLEISEDLE